MCGKLAAIQALYSKHFAENEAEALSSLQAAIQFRDNGKLIKAARLLEHALALAPRNADVLTE